MNRRVVLWLSLLLSLFGLSALAAERIELVASAQQTASGNSASFKVSTIKMAMVGVDVTAVTAVTDLDVYLEGSDDAGTTWYEIPCDFSLRTESDGTPATVSTNQRDIASSITATGKFVGIFKHLPADYVRLRWILAGTNFTMSASLVGK